MKSNVTVLTDRVQNAYEKIRRSIPENIRSGRFLDIGCGIGNGVIAALQNGASLSVGIDRSFSEFGHEFSIDEFDKICDIFDVDSKKSIMLECNIFESRFSPNTFDYAMMLDSLEHVPTPEKFIQYAFECLRPGGFFLIDTCPLYYSPVGHHLFAWFSEGDDPWPHLRIGFEEKCENFAVDAWSMERYRELNKVTHDQIRNYLIDAGFAISHEERGEPNDERLKLYKKYRSSFDPSLEFDERWLFEDWLMIVAIKPEY